MKTQIGLPVQLFGNTPKGRETFAAVIVDLGNYSAKTNLMVFNKDGSSFLASSVRHKDFKKDGENYWDFLEEEYNTEISLNENPLSDIEETEFPPNENRLLSVEEVQEKIVKSLTNTNWITRESAIKMIDNIMLPTLGSEADIKFWEGISDSLKQKVKTDPMFVKPTNSYGMPQYLVKYVDPQKEYPVSYTIKQDGTRVYTPTTLKGEDLTEPQIIELFFKGLL